MVSEDRVPSYRIVEEKIREIDNTIIIARVYYIFNNGNFIYRFQLIKKERMCIIDIPRKLLDNLKDNLSYQQELTTILNSHILRPDCWAKFEQ